MVLTQILLALMDQNFHVVPETLLILFDHLILSVLVLL